MESNAREFAPSATSGSEPAPRGSTDSARADISKLLRILAKHAVEPRIDDARAFAEKNLVLLLRHTPSDVDLDLSLGWTDFERAAIASSTNAAFGRASYPMALAEDLVVFNPVLDAPDPQRTTH